MSIEQNGTTYQVPCRKCNFCLQNRRNEWAFRLTWEIKRAMSAHFITLTYNTDHVPIKIIGTKGFLTLDKDHLKQFHKNLKQVQNRFITKLKIKATEKKKLRDQYKIKYYAVGEYGTKFGRPHYHTILFNLHPEVFRKLQIVGENNIWKYGDVHRGDVNEASIQYCAKYLIDKVHFEEDALQQPFAMMSKGLGDNYIKPMKSWHKKGKRLYVQKGDQKLRMPRYYKDKIFTKMERQILGEQATQQAHEYDQKIIDQKTEYHRGDKVAAMRDFYKEIEIAHDQIRIKSNKLNKL